MRKRNLIVCLALLLALTATAIYKSASANNDSAPVAGCSFAKDDVALLAATATVAGKPEVHLRWMTKRGWVPGITFNLYRVGSDQKRARLNGEPLGSKAGAFQISSNNARVSPEFKYAETLNVARRPLPPGAQIVVDSTPIQRMDSAAAFTAMRDTIKQMRLQQVKSPGLTTQAFGEQVMNADGVRPYLQTLRKGIISADDSEAQSSKIVQPSEEEQTREARSTLQLAAIVHPQVARDLGYAFDDQAALPGATYTYELRSVENGQECEVPIAAAQFTVGKDQPIPNVTNLIVAQADEDSVDLRWNRPADQDVMSPTYKITRIDSKGSRATSRPIMVADMKLDVPQTLSDGRHVTHVEPRSFYHDLGVATGKVTYTVVMTDIFGRESAPASVEFTMEDWHTPDQVAKVWAELTGDDVRVSWTPNTDKGVGYRVYRVDADKADAKPELLTTTSPTAGQPVAVPQELEALLSRPANQMTVALNAEVSASSPAPATTWLAYTDKNVPNDHSYRYLVTAVYQNRNDLDSAATYSRVLPVPVTTLLAGPTNLQSKLLSSAPQFATVRSNFEIRAAKPGQANYGGVIELTWDSVPGATFYRIYRANASGYFDASKLTAISLAEKTAPSVQPRATKVTSARPRAAETTSGNAPQGLSASPIGVTPVANLGLRDIQLQQAVLHYVDDIDDGSIPESSYALVGQVNEDATFYDYFPRSQAHTYAYRVVAVNRWNVPAAGMVKDAKYASVRVRVPATLPPSTPVLVSVASDKDGYLRLKIQGNLDNQGVVRYHIYRRDMTVSFAAAQAEPSLPQANLKINSAAIRVVHPVLNTVTQVTQISATQISPLLYERNGYQELATIDAGRAGGKPLMYVNGQLGFRDDTVIPLHEYFYYVVADNGAEKYSSKPSNILNSFPPKLRADAPASLQAVMGLNGGVMLSWPAIGPDAVYIVERAKSSGDHFVQLSGASAQTSYTDHSVLRGRTYIYRIIAVDNDGTISDPSAYPLDKTSKNPDAYPARVKFTVPAVKPVNTQ